MIEPPTMLTIKELSVKTGISQHMIRGLCLQQRIIFVKSGTKYLVNYQKFCSYLDLGEQREIKQKNSTIRRIDQ